MRRFLLERESDFKSGYHDIPISKAITVIGQQFEAVTDKIMDCVDAGLDLDAVFTPLHDTDYKLYTYKYVKTKETTYKYRKCFIRLYAIRLNEKTFLFIGGGIKLTKSMQEDDDLASILQRFDNVKSFLQANDLSSEENIFKFYGYE